MATVGKLIAILEARSAAFSRGLTDAGRKLEQFQRQASRIGRLTRGALGFLGGRALFGAFRGFLEEFRQLGGDQARAVDELTGAFDELHKSVLKFAAPAITGWMEDMAGGLRAVKDVFGQLRGLSRTPAEVFARTRQMMGIGETAEDARRIFEETRTPLEKFEEGMKRLERMRKHGLFFVEGAGGIDTFNRAVEKLNEELEKAQKKKPLSVEREGQFREVRFGQISSRGPFASPEAKAADEALKVITEINRHLLGMISNGKLQVEVSL